MVLQALYGILAGHRPVSLPLLMAHTIHTVAASLTLHSRVVLQWLLFYATCRYAPAHDLATGSNVKHWFAGLHLSVARWYAPQQ